MVQAKQGGWVQKRAAYRARLSSTYIERSTDRAALREAEVREGLIA